MTVTDDQARWLLGRDTGISSKTIFGVMTGLKYESASYPRDLDDLARCMRLLLVFSEWRPRLQEVADSYPEWGPLIREWDLLVTLYNSSLTTDYSRCYDKMRELIAEARAQKP